MQVQNPHNIKYNGTIQGLKYIWGTEGFRGLFKGNGTNCARIVPNSAVKFFSYEQASKYASALLFSALYFIFIHVNLFFSLPKFIDSCVDRIRLYISFHINCFWIFNFFLYLFIFARYDCRGILWFYRQQTGNGTTYNTSHFKSIYHASQYYLGLDQIV